MKNRDLNAMQNMIDCERSVPVGASSNEDSAHAGSGWISERSEVSASLLDRLRCLFSDLRYVKTARLVRIAPPDASGHRAWTVVMRTERAMAECAAQAVSCVIEEWRCDRHPIEVAAVAFEHPTMHLESVGSLIYERAAGDDGVP